MLAAVVGGDAFDERHLGVTQYMIAVFEACSPHPSNTAARPPAYTAEILDRADLTPLVSALPSSGTAALLCVERDPEACHRSLIAQRLTEQHRVRIEHLRPL